MSKRKFVGFLLLMCSLLAMAFAIDDLTSSSSSSTVVERPSKAQRLLRCAAKKDFDIISEYKRLTEPRYVTEYKRFPEYRYSFGIGKRWFDNTKRNLPYSFGFGKRTSQLEKIRPLRLFSDYLTMDNDDNYQGINDLIDPSEMKRAAAAAAPLRSYDFGIGKRNKIRDELQLLRANNIHPNDNDDKDHLEFSNTNLKATNDNDRVWEQY